MNYSKLCIISFILFSIQSLLAQTAMNTSGGVINGANVNISYSVGQLFYQTKTDSRITEGVQQAYEISVVTPVTSSLTSIELGLSIYPNPMTDYLILEVKNTNYQANSLRYEMYTSLGVLLESNALTANKVFIQMQHLAISVYYVKILYNNELVESYKILKS